MTAGATAGATDGATDGATVGASTATLPGTLDDGDGVMVEVTAVGDVEPAGRGAVVVDGTRLVEGEAPELLPATVPAFTVSAENDGSADWVG